MTTHEIPVRLDLDRYATGFGRAMAHLDKAATKELDAANIDPLLRELVKIRASQLNGCAYCVDMHTRDARAAGETEQRLHAVAVWEEAPFFTDRERAALAFTESVTRLATHPRSRRGLRRRRRRVRARGGGRAAQPDRRDQRLERALGRVPLLDARGARIRGVSTFRELHRPGTPAGDAQPVGRRQRARARHARVRRPRHHEQRLRGHAREARRRGRPGRRRRDTGPSWRRRCPCRCRRTSRTGSPTTRRAWPSPSRPRPPPRSQGCSIEDRGPDGIYPADLAVERVAAAVEGGVGTARAHRPRRGVPAARSRPGRRRRAAAALRRGRRRRRLRPRPRPARGHRHGGGARSTRRSTCCCARAARRWPSWPTSASPASPSAARSRSPASARWRRRPGGCSTASTRGGTTWSRAPGSPAARSGDQA